LALVRAILLLCLILGGSRFLRTITILGFLRFIPGRARLLRTITILRFFRFIPGGARLLRTVTILRFLRRARFVKLFPILRFLGSVVGRARLGRPRLWHFRVVLRRSWLGRVRVFVVLTRPTVTYVCDCNLDLKISIWFHCRSQTHRKQEAYFSQTRLNIHCTTYGWYSSYYQEMANNCATEILN